MTTQFSPSSVGTALLAALFICAWWWLHRWSTKRRVVGVVSVPFVHPVKSCAGTGVKEACVDRRELGFAHDRKFVIVETLPPEVFTTGGGVGVLTIRDCPQMATLKVSIGADGKSLALAFADGGEAFKLHVGGTASAQPRVNVLE